MAATGLDVFDKTLQSTNIYEIMEVSDTGEKMRSSLAVRVLAAVLFDRVDRHGPMTVATH